MIRFEYVEPKTLQEATSLLSAYGEKATVLAGGTDLLIALKLRQSRPQYVVNIKRIPGLDGVALDPKDGLRFGALVTCRMLEYSPEVRREYPMLAETAGLVGSAQIRTTATVAGNLCNALPSAEMAPPLLALNAEVTIASTGDSRTIPLLQFFTGPRQTVLQPGELLTEVHVPPIPENTGMIYVRHSPRRAMDLAVVGVAAVVTMDGDMVKDARIALGAVSPTPMRATEAEQALIGQRATDEVILKAAALAAQASKPISDIRASAEYRREMVAVLTRRMVKEAIRRSRLPKGQVKILKYPMSMDFSDN